MTRLTTLSKNEVRLFDYPPKFSFDERQSLLVVTTETRQILATFRDFESKVGFLLQLGYFKATGKFFTATQFRKKDIKFVRRILGVETFDLATYRGTVVQRHRDKILELTNWRYSDNADREQLISLARREVASQEYPKRVLARLVDMCWKHRWVVPSYRDINDLVTSCYNDVEKEILKKLETQLDDDHIEQLEELLEPIERPTIARSKIPITKLKTIDQSSQPKRIQASMTNLALFRLLYMKNQSVFAELPLNDKATLYHATWLEKADAQQLSQFTNRYKTYLHLLAFIKHQFYQRQDSAIDLFIKSVTSAKHTANKSVAQHDQDKKAARDVAVKQLCQAHLSLSIFAKGVVAITQSSGITPNEKFQKIESLVEDYLDSAHADDSHVQSLDNAVTKDLKQASYYEALSAVSLRLQRRVSTVVKHIIFDDGSSDPQLVVAPNHFKEVDGVVGPVPPLDFLKTKEKEAVFTDGTINTSLYKCLLFIHMAQAIKAGRLNLLYSYRYRAIQEYLISPEHWNAERTQILKQTGLSEYANGPNTLDDLRTQLDQKYEAVNRRYLAGNNPSMTVSSMGKCQVRTAGIAHDTHSFISSELSRQGIVPILQLLKEINQSTGFMGAFQHFSNKRVKMKLSEEILLAGVLAKGCNIGLGKLAKISTGLQVDKLRNAVNWCFSQSNIQNANRHITERIAELAIAKNYLQQPPTVHTSSDGRKVSVAQDCLHANYSFKYLGKDKGVTDYTFVDERHSLFHSRVFSASDREAAYLIDGLLDNQVPEGHIHSTDTHGYTEQIFCATHLMGISFAPRLANLGKHRLYAFSARQTYAKKDYVLLPSRPINKKLILENWDDILRFMATIKSHHTSASQLFKRLSSYTLDHPLYRALKEFGRVIKSLFILTYYEDQQLRQRIQKQLNRVELANKFSAAVFFESTAMCGALLSGLS